MRLIILIVTLISISNAAHEYWVSSSGNENGDGTESNPFNALSKAFAQVVAGDKIHILPGTYIGERNCNLKLPDTNGLQILGSSSSNVTEFSCRKEQTFVFSEAGKSGHWTFRNVTISGSSTSAARVNNGGHLDFYGCAFNSNSGDTGGALFYDGGTSGKIQDCRFDSNHGTSGGAIHSRGDLTISNCIFRAGNAVQGGALFLRDAKTDMSNVEITGCSAKYGGAVYADNGRTNKYEHVYAHDNTAASNGGSFYFQRSANVEITASQISKNKAGQAGAGLYCDGGEIHADASIFSQNQGTGISCPNKCVFKGTYQCGCTDC